MTVVYLVLGFLLGYGFARWDERHQLTWEGRFDRWRCLWLVRILRIKTHVQWDHPSAAHSGKTMCRYCKIDMEYVPPAPADDRTVGVRAAS